MSVYLTTLTAAKTHLKITGTATFDAKITKIIQAGSRQIERYCNRKFKALRYTEFYDGKGSNLDFPANNIVIIKNPPIISLSTLYDDTSRAFASSSLIPTSSYTYDPDSGIVELVSGVFSKGVKNIKIIYTGGYTETTYSSDMQDVEEVCLIWVGKEWKRYFEKIYGRQSSTRGDVTESLSMGSALDEDLKDRLSLHRLYSM